MIAATLHGPSYSPSSYDFDTIETFPNLQAVIETLFDRYTSNGKSRITMSYLDGTTDEVLVPAFDTEHWFTCYEVADVNPSDEDEVEGQRLEAHTAVHGGWFDYVVKLHQDINDIVMVTVQKAGI